MRSGTKEKGAAHGVRDAESINYKNTLRILLYLNVPKMSRK